MEWTDDETVMARLDDLMKSLNESYIPFLNHLYEFEGDNPNYFLLFCIGKLAVYYENAKNENEHSSKECLMNSMATLAEDPMTQAFISEFVGDKIHEGITPNESI